jgi:hypothetical protein
VLCIRDSRQLYISKGMEGSGRGASSVRGLLFGDPEGPREEGSEDGYFCSPGNLRDRGLRGRICLFTGNSER